MTVTAGLRDALADVAITGVGDTSYGRLSASAESLATQAVVTAAADAGIDVDQIDGFCSYPGHVAPETLVASLGLSGVGLRMGAPLGGAGAVAALADAATAIATGRATNVVIYRAIRGKSGKRKSERPRMLPAENYRSHLERTHGLSTPAQHSALRCRRYMYEYDVSKEQLGAYTLLARQHAQLNPRAQMYGRPVTLDDYLGSPVVADPYSVLDCCLESDGACAVVVGPATGQRRGVRVLAVADAHPQTPDDISNRPDFLDTGLERAARRCWEQCGSGPEDMDAAMIYDCFTFEVLGQLEAAGFVPRGRAGAFLENGHGRLGGRLPLNTHGGLMAEGHMAGLAHVVEAVRQLRGECGPRQVDGAARIAVTGWGGFGDGAMAILATS